MTKTHVDFWPCVVTLTELETFTLTELETFTLTG